MFSPKSKKEKKKDSDTPKKPNRGMGSLLKSVLSSVKIGSDVMSQGISLPAWLYEPLTILQRSTEVLEYHKLLNKAADAEDQFERMAYLAAFAVSSYSSITRLLNNFNPTLGETYEYSCDGMRYFAEQVSHHPPVCANIAENDKWTWFQNASANTKFLGNILEIDTTGRTHFIIKETGEEFFYTNPLTRLHNLVLGKLWIQHCGELHITNKMTGDTCLMVFKKAGILHGGPYYDVEGVVKDADGNDRITITAAWNQDFIVKQVDREVKFSNGRSKRMLWKVSEDNCVGGLYDFTHFANTLNDIDEMTQVILPPTDSRLRHDKIALENLEYDESTRLKKIIEERQREERGLREEAGEEWVPTWFTFEEDDHDGGDGFWMYKGGYWEEREAKVAAYEENPEEIPEDLLDGGNAKGTAADYRSYGDMLLPVEKDKK